MKTRRRCSERPSSSANTRLIVCEEAARIMEEQGIRDFQMAKTKAVERLGVGRRYPLPTNREIEESLRQRLKLFGADDLLERCRLLWKTATDVMEMFSSYEPRVVGALSRGVVTDKTPVELHLFPESPEDLAVSCIHYHLPFEGFDKRVRFPRKRFKLVPGFRFARGDVNVELVAFESKGIREAPLCPVEGRPMSRISLPQAREILAST